MEKLSTICRGAMRSYGYVNKQQQAMQQLQLATTIGGSGSNKYRIENRCK